MHVDAKQLLLGAILFSLSFWLLFLTDYPEKLLEKMGYPRADVHLGAILTMLMIVGVLLIAISFMEDKPKWRWA